MSAITGIFRRDGSSVNHAEIKNMNDNLSHRGRDGSKIWFEGPVALGHQMLHTTAESINEELPYEDDNNRLVITADARIDNRRDLSEKLCIKDVKDVPDSFFILKAYEKWGDKCPEKLLGDFCFVIWDKDKEILFCARDHMGVKPFYYYMSDESFFFATEMKALFSIPEVPCELNELKIAFYLMQVSTDKKLTFYKDICRLSAASSLTIGKNSTEIDKYWKVDPESQIIMDSDEDYIQAFSDIFAEAVNCRLRSALPLGFELSGGLDSSSVVCMARNILNNNPNTIQDDINTFSMIFKDFPNVDESYYIKKVANISGITSHLISSDKISPLENIDKVFWHQEQPFNTPNMSILCNMQKRMKDNGIRILLTGSGGDQTINLGRNYFRVLFTNIKWQKLIMELYRYSKNTKVSMHNLFFEHVIIPSIPMYLKNILKKLFILVKKRPYVDNKYILNKDFATRLGGKIDFKKFVPIPKTARGYHYFVINNISHQEVLEMRDKRVSAFDIEPRYPFYDKRLIEFCYAIPDEMKFKFGWNRYIQRMAMENMLPKEVQWRPFKRFFGDVFEKNLIEFEKSCLKEIFFDETPKVANYVDLNLIRKFYIEYDLGRGSINSNTNLWRAVLMELWLNHN